MRIVIVPHIVHNEAILNSTKNLRWGILNSGKCDSNICDIFAVKDWEQRSWEQGVISCDQTTDSKVVATNQFERAPSSTHSFKYKWLPGAGVEAGIMSLVMDYYYLERRLLLLLYLRWLAWINNSQCFSSPLLFNWFKLWKDGDACRRSAETLSGHRKSEETGSLE